MIRRCAQTVSAVGDTINVITQPVLLLKKRFFCGQLKTLLSALEVLLIKVLSLCDLAENSISSSHTIVIILRSGITGPAFVFADPGGYASYAGLMLAF